MPRNTTLNETLQPSDAVISTSTNTVTIDFPTWVIATLRQNWNTANTDEEFPNIEYAELTKTIDFRSSDWVRVWGLPSTSEPVTIPYQFTNDRKQVQLDIFTTGPREHANKVVAELRRIVEANKTDTFSNTGTDATNGDEDLTGRIWMIWNRANPFDQVSSGMWRRQIDLELRWRFRRTSA